MSTPEQSPSNGPDPNGPPHKIALQKKIDNIYRMAVLATIVITLAILGYVLTKIPFTSTVEVTRKGSLIHLPVWLGMLMAPGIFGLILYQSSKEHTTQVISKGWQTFVILLVSTFCIGGIWAQWGIGQKYITSVLGG